MSATFQVQMYFLYLVPNLSAIFCVCFIVVAFMIIFRVFSFKSQLKVLQYKHYFLPENCTINEKKLFLVSGTVFYLKCFGIVWMLQQYPCVFVTHISISVLYSL